MDELSRLRERVAELEGALRELLDCIMPFTEDNEIARRRAAALLAGKEHSQ